ncbi:GNAT family N-acetyltransferase [Candidatus Nitrosocosmicus sp. R]
MVGSVRGFQVDETVFIKRLIINPHFQNQAMGTNLIKSIEDSFKDNKRYELFTSHKSNRNLHLYKKNGYKEFNQIPIHENLTMIYLEKHVSCR